MKKWLSLVLPFIGLAIFAWIVYGTGPDKIIESFRAIDPKRLLIFPVFTFFFLWLRGVRWLMLTRIVGIDVPLLKSTLFWSIGFFAASVTPGKVGDALRAFYLSRETGKNFGECFLTVFIDRLMDLVIVLTLGLFTILIYSYYYIRLPSIWIVVIAVVGIFAVLYLLLRRGVMRKLLGPMFRALAPERYREELSLHISSFYDSLGVYAKRWRQTMGAFFFALIFWATVMLLAYTVTRVLSIDVSLGYLALMMPTVTLVELIPISVAGLGTREAAVIYFFSVIGIASAQAVGFSIMYLILGTYLTALVGFFAWLFKPAKLSA
jgi:uncharacterized protein (TIRG00374 family)